MKPKARTKGRRQLTLELSPQANARLNDLSKLLDCSKVATVQRALSILALCVSQRLQTPDGKTIIPL